MNPELEAAVTAALKPLVDTIAAARVTLDDRNKDRERLRQAALAQFPVVGPYQLTLPQGFNRHG